MIATDRTREIQEFASLLSRCWGFSAEKIERIESDYDVSLGAPVFTAAGRYTSRGWTEWTQGFQYGSALLHYDGTGRSEFLDLGRERTLTRMAGHITHTGVHDHGFNNVSTYGNLLRLAREAGTDEADPHAGTYALALQCSGAVQACRWTPLRDGGGFIYSFNGPHSLFADTIRSLRALAWSHRLGHTLMVENDEPVSLLGRLVDHARATAAYTVYYGDGRDGYDVRGRVAHESVFNVNDGRYRCPNSQQGYSPFSTWTRGLAWVVCGFAELLEFIDSLGDEELAPLGGRAEIEAMMSRAGRAAADFYIENTPTCGVPYWDTGAPLLHRLGDYLSRPADPFNEWEPVDSSAAAIAAQGLLRLGTRFGREGDGRPYRQAGLTVADTLLREPYLCDDADHQGLLLHSVYHRPNGWDAIPAGQSVPCGESSMWGDYHLRELALLLQRELDGRPAYRFF